MDGDDHAGDDQAEERLVQAETQAGERVRGHRTDHEDQANRKHQHENAVAQIDPETTVQHLEVVAEIERLGQRPDRAAEGFLLRLQARHHDEDER